MNTRQRIAKLEGVQPVTIEPDNRDYAARQEWGGAWRFYIDGVEVDTGTYDRESKKAGVKIDSILVDWNIKKDGDE